MSNEKKTESGWMTGLALAAGAAAGYFAFQRLMASGGPQFRLKSRRPETAVITGASSGIGAVFARKLAQLGYNVVLVARREDRLKALAQELGDNYGIHAETLVADLAQERDVRRVEDRLSGSDSLTVLINNAGFGFGKEFLEIEPAELDRMLDVHLKASIRLCHAALPGLQQRGRGAIVNVSSIMGFMAIPGSETYCATKSFLTVFSRALARTAASSGICVQALCPGLTRTEFHEAAHYKTSAGDGKPWAWMSAREVVEASLAGLEQGRDVVVPGALNQVITAVMTSPFEPMLRGLIQRPRRGSQQREAVLR